MKREVADDESSVLYRRDAYTGAVLYSSIHSNEINQVEYKWLSETWTWDNNRRNSRRGVGDD